MLVVVAVAVLAVAAPALGRVAQAGLLRAVARGVSGSVTYRETAHGRDVGQSTLGVVGRGTISGKLSLDAKLAATFIGAVRGLPLTAVARGGSYVYRYDIEPNGDHKGLVVISFASSGLGSLCATLDVAYGKFSPGASDFVPSTSTFTTIGGEGRIATVHASARVTQGEVTGAAIEKILGSGPVVSLSAGKSAPMTKDCAAVAKLASG